jgi:hypothetical protein
MWKDRPQFDSLQDHAQTTALAEALRLCGGSAAWFGVDCSPPSSADVNLWSCTSTSVCMFVLKYSDNFPCCVDKYEHTDISCFWQSCLTNAAAVNWRSEVMTVHQLSLLSLG